MTLLIIASIGIIPHCKYHHRQLVVNRREANDFLFGENGSAVKDLSNSYMSRISPTTKGIQSILGNQFVQSMNNNTIRPAKDFKNAKSDTLLGDNNVPLRNIRYYY